jgi:RNA-directed DNA polymerase
MPNPAPQLVCAQLLHTRDCPVLDSSDYAHKSMFDAISTDASAKDVVMTCYVDDLTLSGKGVNRLTLQKAKRAIRQEGLAYHKEVAYGPNSPKVVTGVVLTHDKTRLPNRRHKAIQEDMNALKLEDDPELRKVGLARLLGRITEAAQVDSTMRGRAPWLLKTVQDLASSRTSPTQI